VVAFLILAEVLGRTHVISPSVLPLTSTVLARTIGLAGNPQFLGDLAATLLSWAIGLALAVVVAVPLGVVLGSLPGVRAATRAIVEFLRPIPSVALILLVGLILGPGLRETVTLIVYAAIWPVLFNTIYGLDDADPVARETLRAFGFGRLSVIRFASLPGAAPFIATGIRLASSIAIILNISTGYLTGRVSGNGLGAYIAEVNTGSGNTDLVLAAAIWAGVLGLVLNGLLLAAQRRLLPWHRELAAEAA
jgi:NitT/TauT family transport system permease protein